jgi:hypothetical protein
MFTHRLLHFGLHTPPVSVAPTAQLLSVALSRARQAFCAIRGHDLFLHFERRRLSLQCATCGWNSPGWTIDGSTLMSSPSVSDRPERGLMEQVVRGQKSIVAK